MKAAFIPEPAAAQLDLADGTLQAFFDTVINAYLISDGGLDIHRGDVIGVCAESHCEFLGPLAFPETVHAGLRVAHLGRSSVRYEIGIFGQGAETAAAQGHFVHVYVDRHTRRPVDLPAPLRAALEPIRVASNREES